MRRAFVVVLVIGFAFMVVTPGLATPTATDSPSKTHTLVVTHVNGSVGYTVTASGNLTLKNTESGDSISRDTVNGRVGGLPWKDKSSDKKDVIKYTGKLRDFDYDGGKIRLTLDGKRINPDKLVGTPPPPPQTPTSTPTSTSTSTPNTRTSTPTTTTETITPPSTAGPSTTTYTSAATTPAPTSTDGSPTDTGGTGLLGQLIPLITGLGAIGAVLYVLFGDS